VGTAVIYSDYLQIQPAAPADSDVHLVSLVGELDAFVAPSVVDHLSRIGGSTVQIDVSRLTLIDGAGVGALLEVERRLQRQGQGFRVQGANGVVRRVFEVLNFEDWLD
jgi:anti-anti-sigma factor